MYIFILPLTNAIEALKSEFLQGWIQGWKTDGVIIDASAASMLRGRLCEQGGAKRQRGSCGRGPGAQPPEFFWSLLSVQTTRRSNLALAGRRLNHFLWTLITSLVV